jgi:NAD(P)-dependent dehydrogenase (short-subunit alcohol dehydrogenase family)
MDGKNCVVTGASNGIGRETARVLASMGASVALIGRDTARGRKALEMVRASAIYPDRISYFQADFSSLAEVRDLSRQLRVQYERIDRLINNAGAMFVRRQETADGFEMTFGVNHLAAFVLTANLLDRLKAGVPARIINVASDAHLRARLDFDDLQSTRSYSGIAAYGRSKLANIYFTRSLAARLEGSGIAVNCLHPGFVRSGFARNNGLLGKMAMTLTSPFALSVRKGADTVIYLASSPDVAELTGRYFYQRKEAHVSAEALDDAASERLWRKSSEMTGDPFRVLDQLGLNTAS